MLQNTIVMSSFEQQWQSIVSVFSAPKNAQIRALQVNYRDLNLFRSGHKPAVNMLFIYFNMRVYGDSFMWSFEGLLCFGTASF